ncbi:MAG: isoprenylcysteine carboxylmethyltransferase family protein [Vicinamibacteria bacterium]
MHALELKIPPVAVALATGAAMAALSWAVPFAAVGVPARVPIGLALALGGIALCAAGVAAFRRARTTVNPMTPDASSSLVAAGVYAHTRNPMYLGFAIILAGWGAALANVAAFSMLPLFVLYIDRYQIAPEEKALAARFGPAFASYAKRVRRWL